MRNTIIATILVAAASFANTATNATMLLAEVNGGVVPASSTSSALLGVTPTNAVLLFGYGFNSSSGGTQPLGLDADYMLGASVPWALGSMGTYDFSSTNSSDFGQIVARLTNGVNESDLFTGGLVQFSNTQSGNLPFLGIYISAHEFDKLGLGTDLQGASVEFIRLAIDKVFFDLTEFTTVARLDWEFTANWQIWGTAAAVPEPASLTLFTIGLVGLGFMARRRRGDRVRPR